MADNLRVILGGTTDQQDGTDVSEGGARTNPLIFSALNVPRDVHLRCDDGYWTNSETLSMPAELEVSFDGGSSWYGVADNPIAVPEIEDVNSPVKFRQIASVDPGSEADVIGAAGSFSAITALSTPTLTATPGDTEIDLSWTNVANEDASPGYTLQRSTAANFSANLVTVTKDANVTTHTATGLTNGTPYYFRVRAEGSGRYGDSGYGTDDATPYSLTTASFSPSMDGYVQGYHTTNSWGTVRGMSPGFNAVSNGNDNLPAGFSRGGSADCAISRIHLHFDTSSLPDGATIVAARLKVWGHETYVKSGYHSSTSAVLLESTTTAGVALTTSNFPYSGNLGSTELASRKAYADWTDGAYNTFTLNASGLALINKTGTTRLAFVEASDFDNADPGAGTARGLQFYPSEYATSGKRPVLEIDYT